VLPHIGASKYKTHQISCVLSRVVSVNALAKILVSHINTALTLYSAHIKNINRTLPAVTAQLPFTNGFIYHKYDNTNTITTAV